MASPPDRRTPVVLLADASGEAEPGGPVYTGLDRTARALLDTPGTVVIRHDLTALREGIVRRTMWYGTPIGPDLANPAVDHHAVTTVHELAHGCVSCTLRADLLPLLCLLAARDSVRRIVIALDPAFEVEAVCHAIAHVPVTGVSGRVDGPAGRSVQIEAVITGLDARTWQADAVGEETLAERGRGPGDDRTVAQVAVGQVEFADAIMVFGAQGVSGEDRGRLTAILARLTPRAPIEWAHDVAIGDRERIEQLLTGIAPTSRRGRIFDAHAPLLRDRPPLHTEFGVTLVEFAAGRPFHPARLHEALDVLFEGVITARGRIWLATQPDEVVWLESAGGGLRVGGAGPWLAVLSSEEIAAADPDRRALAAMRWDEHFGDRDVSMTILVCDADPDEIRHALHWALVDDAEFHLVRTAPEVVAQWFDPFGDWHEDPCETTESTATPQGSQDRKVDP